MKLKQIAQRPEIEGDDKLNKAYTQFNRLIDLLSDRNLSDKLINEINEGVDELNSISESQKLFRSQIRKRQLKIVMLVEQELKLVVKHHYRNTWLVIGMTAFGIPLGIILSAGLTNMAIIWTGVPLGIVFGFVVGTILDRKAFKDGKQLDLEFK